MPQVSLISAAIALAAAAIGLMVVVGRRRQRGSGGTRRRDGREERFEELFDHLPVPVLEEDFMGVSRWLDSLRARGVEDLRAFLQEHPDEVQRQFGQVRVTAANRRALALFGADDLDDLGLRLKTAGAAAPPESFPLELEALWKGQGTLECATTLRLPDRPLLRFQLHWHMRTRRSLPQPSHVIVMFRDPSPVRVADELYQQVFESLPIPAWVYDAEHLGFLDVNRAAMAQYGWSRADFLAMRVVDVRPRDEGPDFTAAVRSAGGESRPNEVWRHRAKDGRAIDAEVTSRAIDLGGRRAIVATLRDVTEARRAEAALRDSEERFRTLFEHAVEGVYESLPGGRFRSVNPAFAGMLGYANPGELLALEAPAIQEIYVEPGRRAEFLRELGSGGVLGGFESEVRRRDGTTLWISENVRAERDEAGRILRIQGFVRDITGRKRAEVALREGEARYRALFEESPVAIMELDYARVRRHFAALREVGVVDLAAHLEANPDERQRCLERVTSRQLNAAAVRVLQAQVRSQLLGPLTGLLAPSSHEPLLATLLALWRGEGWAEGEAPLRCFDGAIRRFYWRWWTAAGQAGGLPAHAQIALLDVTAARRTEAELRASEQRFRLLFELSPVAIAEFDFGPILAWYQGLRAEGVTELGRWFEAHPAEFSSALFRVPLVGANAAALRLLGAPSVAELARQEGLLLTPDGVAARRACLVAAWTGRNESEGEIAVRALDGSERRVYYRWRIPMIEGRPYAERAQFAMLDLTEVRLAERRLAAEQLRASKLESVGFLAGGIAHDFNNLLAVIMGNLSLALLEEEVVKRAGRWLREAEHGAQRARQLTQQLLTFAKGGAPVRTTVQLQDVVREAAEFATRGSAVRCEFDLAADLKAADADKGQIGAVVQNLVLNAIQAMPEGGAVLIALRNELVAAGRLPVPAGPYLRLSITDAGAGIPPEYLSHIFEPYFTTRQEGAGLGLATVYSIVRKHQGHVSVESEVGRGTSFHVWLPAAAAPLPEPAAPRSPFAALSGRVLFMDDEEALRLLAEALLVRLGMEVVVVGDGAQALEAFAAARTAGRPFDLVMMDLTVPGGMGGLEAMRGLLAIDPGVRAIVSSGYSGDPVMANYQAYGFRGRAPKPYRAEELARVLREVLEANP
jgi:PAS domain S-box-containing protein